VSAFRLARRNLMQSRTRLVMAAGGVALALTLILTLDAVFAGVARQLTTYIDRSGADVIVGQRGVRNLHMVASWLPADIVDAVSAVDGVAAAEPLLYVTDTLALGDDRFVAYVMAPEAGASMGGPWIVSEGSAIPNQGEVLIDVAVASEAGVGLGDPATVRGRTLRIAGLIEGTSTLLNSIAFIAPEDFLDTASGADLTSFVLVRIDEGAAPEIVAARIEGAIDGVSALARPAFAAEERRLVTDMGTDILAIMSVIGFIIGLAVVALTMYIATVTRRAEYGVLAAVGAPRRYLYEVVIGQAFLSSAVGFLLAVALTATIAFLVPRTGLSLELEVTAASVSRVGLISAVIAGAAAVLPIRQLAGLDPATVFRRGAT
jgi:putative ABC transport system permease protein